MNALKAFVVIIGMLFSVATAVTASAATVVTLSPVIGEEVGKNTTYWAGILVYDINGTEMLLMNAGPWGSLQFGYPQCNDCVLYSRSDIINGTAPGTYAADEQYGRAAQLFSRGLLGYNPPDPLWAASFNEMVWDTLWGDNTMWDNANQIADSQTGATYKDIYNSLIPQLVSGYDYSGFMQVIASPSDQALFLVYSGAILTPIPPAIWLFGSGILGLIGIARIKKR